MTEQTPTLGHNQGPPLDYAELEARILADIDGRILPVLEERDFEALVSAEAARIESPADLEAATDRAVRLRKARQWLDGKQKEETGPLLSALEKARNLFKPRIVRVQTAEAALTAQMTDYNRRVADAKRAQAEEAARKAREEQEQRFAQADTLLESGLEHAAEGLAKSGEQLGKQAAKMEKMAAGSTADLARASTLSGTSSSRLEWKQEITDEKALRKSLGKLGAYFTTAELDKAIRAFRTAEVRSGNSAALLDAEKPALKGVRFWQEDKAFVR